MWPILFNTVVVDGVVDEADVQLSSGILISTGTGSAAWIANATQVVVDTVERVLEEVHEVEPDVSVEIADRINQDIIFEPCSPLVRYFVRELVSNGLRPQARHRGGLVNNVTVRSRGWDPTMTLDGIHEYALPAGQRAHFATDESGSLLTCAFPWTPAVHTRARANVNRIFCNNKTGMNADLLLLLPHLFFYSTCVCLHVGVLCVFLAFVTLAWIIGGQIILP